MASPVIRPFAETPGLAASERRMITAVRLRTEHWAELDSPQFRLMYDHDDRKEVESRGTEAVLNALILALDDAGRGRPTSSSATRTALKHLWATQTTEGGVAGSWDWINFGLEPWEGKDSQTFGAALAAIAVGSAPGYLGQPLDEEAKRGVGLLRDYLGKRFPQESLYYRIWITEASTTFEGLLSADQKNEVINQLLAVRRADGGWALADLGNYQRVDGTPQSRESDGYATGLALHAILRAGKTPERPEVIQGIGWLRSHQQADGSWTGRSLNKEHDPATLIGRLMTDAATAMASTVLIEAESR